MARTALACLNKTEHSNIWVAAPPMIFGSKVAAAGALLAEAQTLAQKQTRAITGSAEDKDREETELEAICHMLGGALVTCCLDAGDATGSAPYDIAPYDIALYKWRLLRDETPLQRAATTRALRTKVKELLASLAPIDRLILQYNKTPAGAAFIATYFATRGIKDRGHGPAPANPAPAPTP